MADKKITNAGYRMLELLKELTQKPLSPAELLNIIEEKSDNSYRKELINKYLNTLRLLDVSICKVKDKYILERSFELINFDKMDLSIIKFMQNYLNKMQCPFFKDELYETLQIIEQNFSQEASELSTDKTLKAYRPYFKISVRDSNVKTFEKYCIDKYKLDIVYKEDNESEEKKYSATPIKIIYKKGQAVLFAYCFNVNAHKEFVINNIIDAQQMPQICTKKSPSSVTFKLKNRLASAYKLKKDETVIEYGHDYKIIANNHEDKDLLLKRLLRYYDSCEILYPRAMKEKMLNMIEEMENIYA